MSTEIFVGSGDDGIGLGHSSDDNNSWVWNYASEPMLFGTNNIERFRIDAAGIANDNTAVNIIALGPGSTSLVYKNNIADTSSAQTLTNKKIKIPSCQFVDNSDITKVISFDDSGATTGKTLTIVAAQTAARTLTLPDKTDTLVARTTTDTLQNKTIGTNNNTINIVNGTVNIDSYVDQNVTISGTPIFSHCTISTGTLSALGTKSPSYGQEGIFMGSDGALPGAEVGIELVSVAASYIDFSTTNTYYIGRIIVDSTAGNMAIYTGGTIAINIDNAQKPTFYTNTINIAGFTTPASDTAPGTLGDICYDNSYIYVCVGTNTWKRAALTGGF